MFPMSQGPQHVAAAHSKNVGRMDNLAHRLGTIETDSATSLDGF